jgi:hypothetical protein
MGAAIKNEYSYIIGVKLSETNAAVAPDFEYDKVEVGLVNYQPAVIHYIRNKEAAIVKGMNLSAKVYKGSEKTPYIDFEKTVDMAPNSVMPIGTETGGRELDPGDYVSRIRLVASDKIWEFEKRFSVTSEEAKDIKDNSVATAETIEEPAEADLPLWLIAAIIGGALLALAAFILLLILLLKRRKDDKDNNEDSTKGSDKI